MPLVSLENPFKSFVFKEVFDIFNNNNTSRILEISLITLFGFLLIAASKTLYSVLTNKVISIAITNIKHDIFKSVIYKDDLLQEKNTSSYVSLLLNDLKIIQTNYYEALFKIFFNAFTFIFSLIALFYLSVSLGILLIIVFVIPTLIPQLTKKKIKEQTEDWTTKNESYTSNVKDSFTGIDTIRGYGLESKVIKENTKYNFFVERSFAKLNNWRVLTNNIVGFFGMLGFVFVNLYGVILAINEKITIGTVVAIIQLSNTVMGPALAIFEEYSKLMTTKKIRERIESVIGTDDTESESELKPIDFNREITFENVSYGIGDKMILNDVNFNIKKGQKVLITGPSGSGKSTLLKIIQKRIQEYKGNVLYDGKNIKTINTLSYYKNISMINQKPFLFEDTLRNNVDMGDNYDDVDIIRACYRAGLETVVNEKGLDYHVGEDGKYLSGGQRQRIEVARAFLRDRQILLVDEATASLDRKTACDIEKRILNDKELTVISVSHHVDKDILHLFDMIFVLIDGMIVEKGSPDELFGKSHSYVHMLT